jgi:hypothetical protein
MRPRKSPIVLVTVLVVMAAISFGMQYSWSKTGGPSEAPAPTPQVEDVKSVGDARPAEKASDVGSRLSQSLSKAAPEKPTPETMDGPGAKPTGPLILNPRAPRPNAKPEKPKPNPSSTSTQWYETESAASEGQ